MKFRPILAYLILGFCLIGTLYVGVQALSQTPTSSEKTTSQIVVNQLPVENGIVPIELRCDNVKVQRNAVERLSCILKNNSGKPVTAAGVRVTVILERDGKKSKESGLLIFDSIWKSPTNKNKSLIPAAGEYRLEDTPVDYGSDTIDKLEINLDYVEFADRTSVGPDSGTSRIIVNDRTGATKYRNWLSKQLDKSGGIVEKLLPILEDYQSLPEDLGAEGGQENGAKKYRSHIRRIYMTKGSTGVVAQLQEDRRKK